MAGADATEPDWDDVSFVISSRYRVEALLELDSGPSTPSKIAEDTGSDIAHVSRAMGELRDRGMVELKVDESTKKGRIHGLSDAGRGVVESVEGWHN